MKRTTDNGKRTTDDGQRTTDNEEQDDVDPIRALLDEKPRKSDRFYPEFFRLGSEALRYGARLMPK